MMRSSANSRVLLRGLRSVERFFKSNISPQNKKLFITRHLVLKYRPLPRFLP